MQDEASKKQALACSGGSLDPWVALAFCELQNWRELDVVGQFIWRARNRHGPNAHEIDIAKVRTDVCKGTAFAVPRAASPALAAESFCSALALSG
jgi:hypothetical protein